MQNDAEDSECEGEAAEEATDEEEPATEQRRGRLLKNEIGYYVLDAHAINELLDVNKYIEAWPQIPTEELHASSAQHPSHPEYRWLLNTRRVPRRRHLLIPLLQSTGSRNALAWVSKTGLYGYANHV